MKTRAKVQKYALRSLKPAPLQLSWGGLLFIAGSILFCSGLSGCRSPSPVPSPSALGYTAIGEHAWTREHRIAGLPALEIVVGTDDVRADLPWFIALHGFADRPQLITAGPYFGHMRPLRIIAPEGPVSAFGARAWSRVRARDASPSELAADLVARTDELAAFIEIAGPLLGTRRLPFVTGFSQGGHVAFAMALLQPEHIAGAFALAAWVPPEVEGRAMPSAVPLLLVHGRQDDRIPIEWTRALVGRLRERGFGLTWTETEGAHVVSPDMNAILFEWLEEALSQEPPQSPHQ